jgi:tetratricopeptide (TPR) repeat protein
MVDSPNRRSQKSEPEIDISKPGNRTVRIYVGFALLSMAFLGLLLFACLEPTATLILVSVLGVGVLGISGLVAWNVVVRRVLFTWMPLATHPARLMAQNQVAAAEAAFAKALARARHFPSGDPRRGLMLAELAMFAKNQGRMAEAKTLFDESVAILAEHQKSVRAEYFTALNNYAVYFVHLRDHASAQRVTEKALDLTLLAETQGISSGILSGQLRPIQFLLHMNLAFLFIEMAELDEARKWLLGAQRIYPKLSKRTQAFWGDYFVSLRAQAMCAVTRFADAEKELAKARSYRFPSRRSSSGSGP